MPGDRMPGDRMTGDLMPGDRLPGDRLPGDLQQEQEATPTRLLCADGFWDE